MQLFAPDILADAVELSPAPIAVTVGVGLLLWMFGWRLHRFWLVLFAAVGAGATGFRLGPDYGMQPLVASLLLALTAGVMAVTLMRVLAFVAGGFAFWLAAHALAPAWNQPLVCFLAGGLVGAVLFRVWIMVLTSFAGALLVIYGGLCLANQPGQFDVVDWADQHPTLLNASCFGLTALGLLTQICLERRRTRKTKVRKQNEEDEARLALEEARRLTRKRNWFGLAKGGSQRKAG